MRSCLLACSVVLLLMPTTAWTATSRIPVAVSPGSSDGIQQVAHGCTTFSWAGPVKATGYKLTVYEVSSGAELGRAVIRRDLPSGAQSWTAPAAECLTHGETYAWTVGATGPKGRLTWSEPVLFRIAPAAREIELQEALAVVRSYLSTTKSPRSAVAEEKDQASFKGPSSQATENEYPSPLAPAAPELTVSGGVEATSFKGDGSELTDLDPTSLSAAVTVDLGGTGSTTAAEARTNLGAVGQADFDSHSGNENAHHEPTQDTDTTCSGVPCDGTSFTNLQWVNIVSRPAGLDDGDDDTTYGAGPGLQLTGGVFSLASGTSQAPRGNTVASIATNPGGNYSSLSLAIGADRLPVIAHYDDPTQALLVTKCNDAACLGGDETTTTVDSTGIAGRSPSIAIGADGFPVISYHQAAGQHLYVAKCNDPACTGGDETISPVDQADGVQVGSPNAITLSSDGFPIISYRDATNNDLKVAKCNDPACAGGDETLSVVDDAVVGNANSIALGADGLPIISYYDNAGVNQDLWVAKCNDPACAGGDETLSLVDGPGNMGTQTSITIGSDGLPIVAYRAQTGNDLKVAKCNDPACAGSDESVSLVDFTSNAFGISITIAPEGLPVISYCNASTGDVMLAKCNEWSCAGIDENLTTVEAGAGCGTTNITIGADGLPLIAYYSSTSNEYRVLHCASEFCQPYFTRR